MRVTIVGGAAWNLMLHVDRLPDGGSGTVHPNHHHEAIGGAGAGKALNLARLAVDVTPFAGIGDDPHGARLREGLEIGDVDLVAISDPAGTSHHINVMDGDGGRISFMIRNGSTELAFDANRVAGSMVASDVVVVDLAPWTPRTVSLALTSGRPVWTDLHDFDGASTWHTPFVDAAEVVFASGDRLGDPRVFLEGLIERGKRFGVVTLGRRGAVALDSGGTWFEVPAVSGVTVVDTNGAGDAFFAGTLVGVLTGVPLGRALGFGARAAALAIESLDLASEFLSPASITGR